MISNRSINWHRIIIRHRLTTGNRAMECCRIMTRGRAMIWARASNCCRAALGPGVVTRDLRRLASALIGIVLLTWGSSAARADPIYSASSLYNLANSYALAGKPALAILNYERAGLLAPNDPDIEANLHYVRNTVHLPSKTTSEFERAATYVSPTLVSWLGVVGLLLLGGTLLAAHRYPQHPWKRRGIALVGIALVGIALVGLTVANGFVLWPTLHAAVVVTPATPARVSPVPMGDPLFTLAEAETVTMAAKHDDFVLIQTGSGRSGWVSRANIVAVVP
jgi:hypothetical protein